MLSELGLTPAQAEMLRAFADRTIDAYVAAEEQHAVANEAAQ
jgi:hypothetical protein